MVVMGAADSEAERLGRALLLLATCRLQQTRAGNNVLRLYGSIADAAEPLFVYGRNMS